MRNNLRRSSVVISQREVARKTGTSLWSVKKIIKDKIKMKPPKRVKTTKNAASTLKKRDQVSKEIVSLFEGGLNIDTVRFSEEEWVEGNGRGKFDFRNERKYYPEDTAKDDVLDELHTPRVQCPDGTMAHITVSFAGNGTMVEPHCIPRGQTITAKYYSHLLESRVFLHIHRAWVLRSGCSYGISCGRAIAPTRRRGSTPRA